MYGFVNHALELLVIRNYGPAVWEDIKGWQRHRQRYPELCGLAAAPAAVPPALRTGSGTSRGTLSSAGRQGLAAAPAAVPPALRAGRVPQDAAPSRDKTRADSAAPRPARGLP